MPQSVLSKMDILIPLGAAFLLLLIGVSLCSMKNFGVKKPQSRVILILSIGVFISLSILFYKYTIDDAYISLRYARNLANGYGLVFSTDGGARVEGYTNFLWVILETPLFLLKLSDKFILNFVKCMGIVFGIGVIIVTYLLIKLVTSSERIGSKGVLFLSVIPQFSFWAIGGLETTMYIFWLLIGLYFYLVERRNDKRHIWSMIFFVFMSLTRPEGFFFVTALLLWDFTTNLISKSVVKTLMKIILGMLFFILLYGVYFMWRYKYFGYLLPNTFYARSGSLGFIQLLRRLVEMSPFIAYLLPLAVFSWFGYLHFHHSSREKRLLAMILLLLIMFCFASKREWMPGFRYELPFVPILILFSSVGVCNMLGYVDKSSAPHWRTYITKWGILVCLGAFLLYHTVELQKSRIYTDRLNRAHVTLGKWLKEYAPQDASYAGWDMGAAPYYSVLPQIIEIHHEGILSTYITHNEYDVNYFLDLSPSFIVLPPEANLTEKHAFRLFYSNMQFKEKYQLIFSFAFHKEYILAVYKHRDVYLDSVALDEGKRLADKSYTEANQEKRDIYPKTLLFSDIL